MRKLQKNNQLITNNKYICFMKEEKKSVFGNTCVCIARVSTSRQDYEAQINALHKRASEFGYTVIKDIETKESGFRSFDKKEGFNELIEFLNQNSCRIVMCTELSRLSRKKYLLERIKQWFIDNKIQLWVDDISFRLFNETTMETDMTVDIVFSVFAAMAENEMKDKFKRLKRGRTELVKNGYSIGGKTCFGYERIKAAEKVNGKFRSKMAIKEDEAEQIRLIYDWYLNGIDGDCTKCSLSQIKNECIARGFGKYLHSKRNINKALKYEPYTGDLVKTNHIQKNPEYWSYGNTSASKYLSSSSEMKLPMIIDRKTFDEVQEKMDKSNPRKKNDPSSPTGYADKSRVHFSLLAKLIVCPICNSFYCGEYRIRKHVRGIDTYYRCINHKPHGSSRLSMRYLDFAAWSFCSLQSEKYQEYLKKTSAAFDTTLIDQRIENLRQKKVELQNDMNALAHRFLIAKDVVSQEELEQAFNKEANRLKKEISQCDEQIKREQDNLQYQLNALEKAKSSDSSLSKIYGNKNKMKRYIQHVLKSISPEYLDSDYYVLKLEPREYGYQYYSLDLNDYNAHGLPYNIYMIVYKRDNLRPKFRLIAANCEFDTESKLFYLPDSTTGTLENVFGDDEEVYFKSIEYKPMDIYDEDAPGGKEIVELIRPVPAPPPPRKRKTDIAKQDIQENTP